MRMVILMVADKAAKRRSWAVIAYFKLLSSSLCIVGKKKHTYSGSKKQIKQKALYAMKEI